MFGLTTFNIYRIPRDIIRPCLQQGCTAKRAYYVITNPNLPGYGNDVCQVHLRHTLKMMFDQEED